MNDAKTKFTEDELQAYVDGQLNSTLSEQVRDYLEQHPAEAERIAAYQQQNNLLKNLYGQTDESLLTRVRSNYNNLSLKQTKKPVFLAYVASVTWLLIGTAFGWGLNYYVSPEQQLTFNLPRSAIAAHVVFSPEVRHPVEVGANEEAHLVKWLSKRLNKPLKVPNLKSIGYSLVGGRLLSAQIGPAAQFMYENSQGVRITLYVIAESAQNTAFQFFEDHNIKVFTWTDSNMGFAITGSISKTQLLQAAHKIYNDFVI